jgi:predicted ATP-grasp superfamily ATP-dependent carboligase
MEQLMAKLRTANPDYEAALRIIESVERRWNYVQPVGL